MILYVFLFQLLDDIVRGTPSEGEDRPGGVFIGLGNKRTSVHYEKVFTFVGLTVAVKDGCLWIVPHSGRPYFMNNSAGCMQTIIGFGSRLLSQQCRPCIGQDF